MVYMPYTGTSYSPQHWIYPCEGWTLLYCIYCSYKTKYLGENVNFEKKIFRAAGYTNWVVYFQWLNENVKCKAC